MPQQTIFNSCVDIYNNITNDVVNNENLDLYGPASSILTISTMDMVSQN